MSWEMRGGEKAAADRSSFRQSLKTVVVAEQQSDLAKSEDRYLFLTYSLYIDLPQTPLPSDAVLIEYQITKNCPFVSP